LHAQVLKVKILGQIYALKLVSRIQHMTKPRRLIPKLPAV
jgi:hypothetical protein